MGNRADLQTARWRRLRRKILVRDGWECQACGKLLGLAQVDHIKPVFKGGKPFEEANCQVLCVSCHVAKTRKSTRASYPMLSVRRGSSTWPDNKYYHVCQY